jgi:two-component system, LuxR family, sensor kinase FixL
MPGFDAIADPQELRRCLRDLVALSTLPAIWRIYDSDRIAESAADAMLSILNCEYVLLSVPDQSIEVTKVARGVDPDAAIAVAAALREWLTHQLDDQTAISVVPNVGTLRLASGPIGLGDKAVVVAASRQTNFPTAGQHLLLQICANYVTDELELHRRRFVALVERSSDIIGFASLDGTTQYLNPAGLEFMGLRHLDGESRPTVLDYVHPEDHARVREGRWVGEIRLKDHATGAAIPFLVDWFRMMTPVAANP